MKKSMILFLFLQLIIIKADSGDDIIFKGKCEDDKAKTGACMYTLNDYDSKGNTKYAIFDKCGKGEKCDNGYEMCIENFKNKKRKVGESCNYNDDCKTNYCVSNKCTAAKEGDKCDDIECESGLACYETYDSNNERIRKCVKYAKEGDKEEKTVCMYGLAADKDGKCAKFGTVEDKTEIKSYDQRLCKSGLGHTKLDSGNYIFICDSIDKEPECNEQGLKTEGKWSDGSAIDGGCKVKEDYTGKKIAYNSEYSKLKTKLYSEFLDDFKDLDLDKLNSDGMNWKTKEKLLLYEYANEFKAAGIIDSEGKVIKDKKCEYEFIMKNYLHSSFIKYNTIIIAMIALLF